MAISYSLDLKNPNTNDIHLKRLLAFNNLVKEAYDNPAEKTFNQRKKNFYFFNF